MGKDDPNLFYPVREECRADTPPTRFIPKQRKTLSERKWNSIFRPQGEVDFKEALKRIQRGGIHPSIRGVVWEFLLGCYDPNTTFDQRSSLRQQRREQYAMLKAECQRMEATIGTGKFITAPVISEDGEPIEPDDGTTARTNEDPSLNRENSRNPFIDDFSPGPSSRVINSSERILDEKVIQWKRTLHQIGLDVVRTDRMLVFYESEENQAKLWDVLAIYAWVDKDIGYCQGMSDLCSPMVILFENEADAFWCFERLMRRLRGNFRSTRTSIGVQSELTRLASIVRSVDPKLHQHLETLDGGEYLFAFRMLMVLFRREFSFGDTLFLWELMWAMEYNPNLFSLYEESSSTSDQSQREGAGNDKHLKNCGKFEREYLKNKGNVQQTVPISVFLVASILKTKSKQMLKEANGLDDVVKILNEITGKLEAKKACKEALKIQHKYLTKAKKP
ncbi:uncharacterized protein LOC116252604 [Nymphaea colorata]|nr:uncharacterized protein LOC116252604 [Nymphaea colorata]